MKLLLVSILSLLISSSYAGDCRDQALSAYQDYADEYSLDIKSFSHKPLPLSQVKEMYPYDGQSYFHGIEPDDHNEGDYAYIAGAMSWGSFGEEAIIVRDSDCEVIAIESIWID